MVHKAFARGKQPSYRAKTQGKSSNNVVTQDEADKTRYVDLDAELDALFKTYAPKRGKQR